MGVAAHTPTRRAHESSPGYAGTIVAIPRRVRLAWALFGLVGCGRFDFARVAPDGGAVERSCWPQWHAGTLALSAPQRVAELASSDATSNPSLSVDGLTLYFERDDGNDDLFVTQRSSRDAPWAAPTRIEPLTTNAIESRLTPSADGMFAVFMSSRGGNEDLWTATRTSLSDPLANPSTALVASLNTPAAELDPELTADGLGLYYAPWDGTNQRIVVARRASTASAFVQPTTLDELQISSAVADPSLSPDETVIAFSSGATMADNDLFYATRDSRDARFDSPQPLAALDVPGVSDNDIELSSDGCEVYFTSDRGGHAELYVSRAQP